MKGVLAWVKGHLVVVICAVIAVAALPVLLFVSNNMNVSLRESVEEEVSGMQRSLQQISVQYNVEPLDPTAPSEGFSATPNEATTTAVKAVIEAHDRDATRVLAAALARNSAGKEPMLEGLFPAPAPAETTAKRQAAARAWVDAHAALLRRVGAGGPVSEEDMRLLLEARSTQETERRLNSLGASQLPEEELREVRELLQSFRLERVRLRAGDVSFYATPDAFVGVEIPSSAELPSLEQIWDWQMRYWVHEDVVEAAARANTNPESGLVYQSSERPVKRLIEVRTNDWSYQQAAEDETQRDRRSSRGRGSSGDGGGGATRVGPLSGEIRPDFEASITGRAGWPYKANPLYDTRYVAVTAIVDGERIDRFIDAIEAENFMTVIDLDLTEASQIEGIARGFDYGAGSLLRVEMIIETLWLRDWISELAPDGVRERMGLPAREQASREGGEQ